MRVRLPPVRDDQARAEEQPAGRRPELPYSPAGLLELQRTAGNRAVQRLIIGIQDAAEMANEASTIFDSTDAQKQRREIKESPGSEKSAVFPEGESEAMEAAFTQRPLGVNEPLVVIAHGSAPEELTEYLFFKKEVPPTFGGYLAGALAAIVAKAVPDQYRGMIYLSGCDTSVQLDFRRGTSYIERFGDELFKLKPQSQPEIRGNMGEASTVGASTETIEVPLAWIEKHPNLKKICTKIKVKDQDRWFVDSHTGAEATYWPHDRVYQSAFTQFL